MVQNVTTLSNLFVQVGILMHYSTLATALWVGVTARNIYKQVTRKAKCYVELDEPPPPPRPMLRFHFSHLFYLQQLFGYKLPHSVSVEPEIIFYSCPIHHVR